MASAMAASRRSGMVILRRRYSLSSLAPAIPHDLNDSRSDALDDADDDVLVIVVSPSTDATGDSGSLNDEVPEAPMVVFVNSRSGGPHGPVLKNRLQVSMGEEQVFDLSMVKPSEFIQYGLACLEKLADLGDYCAKETREKLRIMVAGGDGTVGWVLGCLGELFVQSREPVPPIGIIPLGTGNDLSRSFG